VKWIDEVLEQALTHMPVPDTDSADAEPAAAIQRIANCNGGARWIDLFTINLQG
jgi:hypothetical protein